MECRAAARRFEPTWPHRKRSKECRIAWLSLRVFAACGFPDFLFGVACSILTFEQRNGEQAVLVELVQLLFEKTAGHWVATRKVQVLVERSVLLEVTFDNE